MDKEYKDYLFRFRDILIMVKENNYEIYKYLPCGLRFAS